MGIFVKDSNINTGTVGSQGSSAQGVTVHNTTIDVSNIERGNSDINTESQVTTVDLGDLINEGTSTAAEAANTTITNGNINVGDTTQTASQTSNQNMQNSNTNTENINQQGGTAFQKSINNEQAQNEQSNQNAGTASGQSTSGGNQQSQGTNSQNGGIASSKSASSGGQGGGSSNQTSGVASKPAGSSSGGKSGSSSGGEGGSAKSGSMSVQGKQGAQGQKAGEVKGKSSTINSTTSNKIIDSSGNISRTGATISNQKSISTKTTTIQGNTNLAHSNTGAKLGRGVRFFVKEIINTVESIKATEAVLATTVMSAAGRILEKVFVDGLVGYVVSGVMDFFGADDIANDLRKFAARNLVGEANTWFYENTEMGKHINELSAIKYDSELAKKIESFSETVIKIAAATAISAVPGGVFILAAVGALEGMGGAAESAYQNALANGEEDLTLSLMSNLGILGSGALDAVAWIFNAKLGQGLMNLAGDIGEIGLKETATNFGKQLFSKETLNNILKPSNLIMNGGQSALQSGGKAGMIFSKYMNGEKVTLSDWADLAATFGFYFVMNTVEDTMNDIVSGYKRTSINKKQYDIPDQINADKLFIDRSKGIDDSSYGINQGVLNKLYMHKRLNNDWLDDEQAFKNFVYSKWPNDPDPEGLEKYAEEVINGNIISIYTKRLIVDYLSQKTDSYDEAFEIFEKSFIVQKADCYDRIVGKYMAKGLSEMEVVKMLQSIDSQGACSYAAVANGIAAYFSDKQELFKESFGFDLYIESNGKKVLNAEELLADLYIFANDNRNILDAELFYSYPYLNELSIWNHDVSKQICLSSRMEYRTDIINKYLQSKSWDFEFEGDSIPFDPGIYDSSIDMTYVPPGMEDSNKITQQQLHDAIQWYLEEGYNVQLGIYKSDDNMFTFRNSDDTVYITTNDWEEGGGHAVYVTGVTDEDVIVSSWGKRLKIPLKEFIGNYFNLTHNKITTWEDRRVKWEDMYDNNKGI